MRLSTVFELLLIALLIAFAASRVIEGPVNSRNLISRHRFSSRTEGQEAQVTSAPEAQGTSTLAAVPLDQEMLPVVTGPTKICTCSSLTCNCCRDFSLPVVPVKGPGCATVSYLHDNAMMITMSFGNRVLRNVTVNSKKPKPICMSMPGGVSRFCGRLYSIKRDGDYFKACLGLELRALDDVEAAVRVSCFRFGPGGVNVEPGEALPGEKIREDEDDDDDFGLGLGDDDDDDDDDDDFGLTGGGADDDDEDDEGEEVEKPPQRKDTSYNDVDSSDSLDSDYTGLSALSEEIFGGFFGSSKKPTTSVIDDDDDDDDDDDYGLDDDDDDDDEEEEEDAPQPPKSQVTVPSSTTPPPPPPQPQPQVNLLVMNPVIMPSQPAPTAKPVIQRRPVKRPAKVKPTSSPQRPKPSTELRVKSTTAAAPLKTTQTTTPSPVKTLGASTASPVPEREATTAKTPSKKKKKKPSRRRRPTTEKPVNGSSEMPNVITTSTMTINVVQGDVNLNQTKPLKSTNSESETPLKIPMSKPVMETKPVDLTKQPENLQVTEMNSNPTTMMAVEVTTQTILQNTIPVDDFIGEKQRPISQEFTMKRPTDMKNDVVNVFPVDSTTPSEEKYDEETTNRETTVQESVSYTKGVFVNNMWHSDKGTTMIDNEATETYSESKEEVTTVGESHSKEVQTADVDQTISATESYDMMDEATDKTEAIIHSNEQISQDEEEENDEDADDEDIDIGAELGLEDDEEEENKEKKPVIYVKPTNKVDDEDDDMFGEILDDDDDEEGEEESNTSKEQVEDRSFKSSVPYQINPILYRLARISSGSVATARHTPRFSEGRNRRNNKRMRFPSLEITS